MNDSPSTRATPPDHIGVLVSSVLMMIGGWGGLYWLVTTQIPRVGQRWVFFVLLFVAITGTAIPVVRWLNVRLTPLSRVLPPGGVMVRQAIWIGLYVVLVAWLRIPRSLTVPVAFFLALALIVIEVFLRSREIPNEQV
jgi:hypothetical protein